MNSVTEICLFSCGAPVLDGPVAHKLWRNEKTLVGVWFLYVWSVLVFSLSYVSLRQTSTESKFVVCNPGQL